MVLQDQAICLFSISISLFLSTSYLSSGGSVHFPIQLSFVCVRVCVSYMLGGARGWHYISFAVVLYLLNYIILFISGEYFAYMYSVSCECSAQEGQKRALDRSQGTGDTDGCELPCWFWEQKTKRGSCKNNEYL